ncbi:MAG: sensor histidine kinase [Flavobacteriales bacterium]
MKASIFFIILFFSFFQLYGHIDHSCHDILNRIKDKEPKTTSENILYHALNQDDLNHRIARFTHVLSLDHDTVYDGNIYAYLSIWYREKGQMDSSNYYLDLQEEFAHKNCVGLLKHVYSSRSILSREIEHYDESIKWRQKFIEASENKTDSAIGYYNLLDIYDGLEDSLMINTCLISLRNLYKEDSTVFNPLLSFYYHLSEIIHGNYQNIELQKLITKTRNEFNFLPPEHFLNLNLEEARTLRNKHPNEAKKILLQTLELSKKTSNLRLQTLSQKELTHIYIEEKQWKKAEQIINELLEAKVNIFETHKIYEYALKIKYHLNKHEEASQIAYSSLINHEKLEKANQNKAYAKWSIHFQTKLNEEKLNHFKQVNHQQKFRLKERYIYILILSCLLILLILLLIIIYIRQKKLKELTEILTLKNDIIENKNRELAKSNSTNKKLFGLIAHDLISPYNHFLIYIKDLKQHLELHDSITNNLLTKLEGNARNHLNLTRNLLMWAKLNLQKIKIENSEFNLETVLDDIINQDAQIINYKQIKLKQQNTNCLITTDRNIMKIILRNIISNSIKHSNCTEISIALKQTESVDYIYISDNGIGIPKFQIDRINNYFSQATNHIKLNLGLGLMISKDLIELLNGKIEISSGKASGILVILKLRKNGTQS